MKQNKKKLTTLQLVLLRKESKVKTKEEEKKKEYKFVPSGSKQYSVFVCGPKDNTNLSRDLQEVYIYLNNKRVVLICPKTWTQICSDEFLPFVLTTPVTNEYSLARSFSL